jgi:hypothetical protein
MNSPLRDANVSAVNIAPFGGGQRSLKLSASAPASVALAATVSVVPKYSLSVPPLD